MAARMGPRPVVCGGPEMSRPNRRFTADEIALIRFAYPVGGTEAIRAYYPDRSPDVIRQKAASLGIKRVLGWSENKTDVSWLTHPQTPEAAYVLGILWADGNLNLNLRHSQIRIGLVADDFDHIHHLFRGWGFCVQNRGACRVVYHASFCHKQLCQFLGNFGYTTKSVGTPIKILAHIPVELRHYFYRGWSDGDGHWGCVERGHYSPVVAGDFQQDWSALEDLGKALNVRTRVDFQQRERGNGSVFVFVGKRAALRFGHYIFSGELVGFPRKRASWTTFVTDMLTEFERRKERPIGVYARKRRFEAVFTHGRKSQYLGLFASKTEAALVRDRVAWEVLRDETQLNMPEAFVPSFFMNYGVSI